MSVLDASVLIAYLDGADAQHPAAESLLAEVLDEDFGINPLTLAELLVAPTRAGRVDAVLSVLADLEVQELSFTAGTAVRLAELRASTGSRMPDCCVLLCAEQAGAGVATFDARLAQAAESRGIPVHRG